MKDKSKVDFLKKEHKREQEKEYHRKAWVGSIIVFLFILASGAVFAAVPSNTFSGPKEIKDKELTPANPTENIIKKVGGLVFEDGESKVKKKETKRLNFLLLGMGGPGHSGPYLTDTIIVASIKPKTGEVAMISIPRDLRVKIPDLGYRKINYINAYGESKKENWGAAYTTKLIEKKFNLDIDYYLRTDFAAFKEVVNKIGGIKVEIDQSFTDKKFPSKDNGFKTISFEKGTKKMNGQKALNYARSRHGTNGQNSDFSRAKRQQKVILAAKNKLMSYDTLANPKKIKGILDSVKEHVTTNMKFSDIVSLAELARKIKIKQAKTLVLDNEKEGLLESTTGTNGAFMLKPKSGNFKKISYQIKNIFSTDKAQNVKLKESPTSSIKSEKLPSSTTTTHIEVQNGTWTSGLAAKTKQKLIKQGLEVNKIRNTNKKPIEDSAIYRIDNSDIAGKKLDRITKKLEIPIKEQHRPGMDIANNTDILLILGRDYTDQ